MAITPPTPPTALPVPPNTNDPGNFDARADAFLGSLSTFQTQTNDLATNTYNNATEASNLATAASGSATAAASSASAAATSATNAASSAVTASTQATKSANSASASASSASAAAVSATDSANSASAAAVSATDSANSAAASEASRLASEAARDQAQVYASQQYNATSTTSNSISAASKTFTIEPSKAFVPGQYLSISQTSNVSNLMQGTVTSYNSTTGQLDIVVDYVQGASGPFTNWSIGIIGRRGASGERPVVIIMANMNAVAGNDYVFDGTYILTMPSAPSAGDTFGISNGSNAAGPQIDFGEIKVKRKTVGLVTMVNANDAAVIKYTGNSTIGYTEV